LCAQVAGSAESDVRPDLDDLDLRGKSARDGDGRVGGAVIDDEHLRTR
jgi:hypothetical protein